MSIVKFLMGMCIFGMVFVAGTVNVSAQAVEQQEIQDDEGEQDLESSYGTVVSIDDKRIIVSEYDYESDHDFDVTYRVGPEVNVKGLKVGDEVDLEFIAAENGKIAVEVTSYREMNEVEDEEQETS